MRPGSDGLLQATADEVVRSTECEHLVARERAAAVGDAVRPPADPSPTSRVVLARSAVWERTVVERFVAAGLRVAHLAPRHDGRADPLAADQVHGRTWADPVRSEASAPPDPAAAGQGIAPRADTTPADVAGDPSGGLRTHLERPAGATAADPAARPGGAGRTSAVDRTIAAMREGFDVVHRGLLSTSRVHGGPDLLRRVEAPSALGAWSYEPVDVRVGRRIRGQVWLRLAVQAVLLGQVQGRDPNELVVLQEPGEEVRVPFADWADEARQAIANLLDRLDGPPLDTYPEPVRYCRTCRWLPECDARRRADDHLSLVRSVRPEHAPALAAAGIRTAADLAAVPPGASVPGLDADLLTRLRAEAAVVIEAREVGRPVARALPPRPGVGLAALPPPSPGDLYLDLEGDPYVAPDGVEYLWGITNRADVYTCWWGHDATAEAAAMAACVDAMTRARAADPTMHVYHYASYEPDRMRALSARYGVRVAEVAALLDAGVLVDLLAVARQAFVSSVGSYALKRLEVFHLPGARDGDEVSDAGASIEWYERWLADRDPALLEAIRAYNERDCVSTRTLHDWLEAMRVDAIGPR